MMTSLATVVDNLPGAIIVSCQQKSTCGQCGQQSSCGTGIVSKALPGKQHQIRVPSAEPVAEGSMVEIGLTERSLLQSAVIVYLIPLFSLLIGAVVGQWLFVDLAGAGEVGVILSALGLAGGSLLFVKRLAAKLANQESYQPSLIRVLGEPLAATMVINAADQDSE
uniref:SoxR reducing system RseC family protein n=1 Tax=Thaumasiovibrio occultus TaxID=1891184 RepID=UPI000B35F2D4|nr:SoxR reducing system RseC family protein [Thaumasiovibrio occultus]